jgi:hypothetical protein
MSFTIDGFNGAGITVTALAMSNIASFSYDNNKRLLKLTDTNGKVSDFSVSDQATWTVTAASFYLTTIVIAN